MGIITSIATFPSSSVSLFVRYREDGGFGGPHHLVVDGGSTGSLFAPTSGSPPPSSPPRPVDVTSLLQHARPATARTREHFPLQCPSTQLAWPHARMVYCWRRLLQPAVASRHYSDLYSRALSGQKDRKTHAMMSDLGDYEKQN